MPRAFLSTYDNGTTYLKGNGSSLDNANHKSSPEEYSELHSEVESDWTTHVFLITTYIPVWFLCILAAMRLVIVLEC